MEFPQGGFLYPPSGHCIELFVMYNTGPIPWLRGTAKRRPNGWGGAITLSFDPVGNWGQGPYST